MVPTEPEHPLKPSLFLPFFFFVLNSDYFREKSLKTCTLQSWKWRNCASLFIPTMGRTGYVPEPSCPTFTITLCTITGSKLAIWPWCPICRRTSSIPIPAPRFFTIVPWPIWDCALSVMPTSKTPIIVWSTWWWLENPKNCWLKVCCLRGSMRGAKNKRKWKSRDRYDFILIGMTWDLWERGYEDDRMKILGFDQSWGFGQKFRHCCTSRDFQNFFFKFLVYLYSPL